MPADAGGHGVDLLCPLRTRVTIFRQGRVMSIEQLVAAVQEHLYLPDPMPLYAVLAAVAANKLQGDPLWLLLVGPPSSGKTELLNPLDGLPGFYRPDDFTVAGLLTKGRNATLGGLLGTIAEAGGVGILVVKDFSTVLAQSPTHRTSMFSLLRRLYDGEVERALGTDGGTRLRFEGKVGMVGAATDAIDRLSDEIGDLGPRMLLYRMPDVDEDEVMRAAARNTGRQAEMRAHLAQSFARFLDAVDVRRWPLATDPDVPELRALARWAVWCRSPVLRDRWGAIEAVPRPEFGTRVYGSLLQLLAGCFTLGLDDITSECLLRRVALDCIPALRQRVLTGLLDERVTPTTRTLSDRVGLPTVVVARICEDLAALGVLQQGTDLAGGEQRWCLSDDAQMLASNAALVPSEVPL
jgi:hypothetical protein